MIFDSDIDVPETDLSEVALAELLGDIKRNSRNRRIALLAPVILAGAVLAAMLAAPPQHGGLALVADADSSDPQLPRVFGSNGVWRLAEPIDESPDTAPGPASMIEAPTAPDAPQFTLSPPDQEDLNSLPASTSGQSLDTADLDWSSFGVAIRIEPQAETFVAETAPVESLEVDLVEATETPAVEDPAAPAEDPSPAEGDIIPAEGDVNPAEGDVNPAEGDVNPAEGDNSADQVLTPTDLLAVPAGATPPDSLSPDGEPSGFTANDLSQANPSTPSDDPTAGLALAFSEPASIVPQSVLVYSAHVSVTVQVVDDDSSVVDWCNTRVDWGDGSVTRVAGADGAPLHASARPRRRPPV